MELSWSTFVLEIINFVVLVWILKRFLYRPVLDVIAERRKTIESKLEEAHRLNEEAKALKDRYGGRLAAWEEERREAADQLAGELENERLRRLKALESDLAEEREKVRVAEERKSAERQRAMELEALRQAAAFSSRVLAEASGPELERRLVSLLLSGIAELDDERVASLREQWGEPPSSIEVTSAFELDASEQSRLAARLADLSGLSVPVNFARDPELIAGVHIVIGAWVLAANVRDELEGFAEISLAAG